jgi:hypothetical protein
MSACGRKLPFKMAVFNLIECPVSVKADIQKRTSGKSLSNDRYTLESSH